jgi:hypothetical protein
MDYLPGKEQWFAATFRHQVTESPGVKATVLTSRIGNTPNPHWLSPMSMNSS